MCIYIYDLLHMPLVFVIFHTGRFPTNREEVEQEKVMRLRQHFLTQQF